MKIDNQKLLMAMLKALADDSRLTLLQLLHEREYAVGELAGHVRLTDPTVSHHLARLREAGLVRLRMVGTQRLYRVNDIGLAKFKQLATTIEQIPAVEEAVVSDDQWIDALGWSEADQQVLRDHTVNGQLTRLPRKQKKLLVVLRWLATLFEAGRLYTEPEVNVVLRSVYEADYVGLRRDLVDLGYLRRERGGGKYWLTPAEERVGET